ncbi:ABC transporter permease [Parabacteroides sp. BX2]|jgi:ABC-2 type transport system permease protein|uniref:ABC transporter permease n=1 Tax=Parabacteroides segnis TaxID=2763058 RepID=A0ABR7DY92_9BACT|nr:MULTISPECIES: ABC transporter permease [Parabacteroides]MBC5642505.1 ABC transporter permease [Parabacteroides segnis]MCM0711797.1 ABC transporter permease [Parabacteroides sp. TA-V-105]
MNKIGLIIKREYLRRVSKKSFILLTLLTPFLFAALVFVPLWLSTIKGDEVRNVAIIDTTGKYASLFENNESFHFIHSDKTLDEYRQGGDKEVFAFLSITDDLLNNPKAATLYSEKQVPAELSRLVNQTLSKQLESEKLVSFNIPNLKEIIRESKINFNVQTIKWSEDGKESASSATVASVIGMVFTFIIYMFIMMYGAMVMQGVMEEKTNRIIEVMISSVRPFDLMMGKIIGIGFVGLTQVFLWGIITTILVSVGGFMFSGGVDVASLQAGPQMGMMDANALASSSGNEIMGIINSINIAEIGISFIIYFIGGYMLYASIFAAIGSAVDSQEDTQQFMAPVTIFMIFALYAGIYSMENPDGPLAFWCSMVPFTSPIVMMVRIPFEIPLWEKLLSVSLLYTSAIGIVWLSAKIYRVGILMYGKKPSIKEMVKWIKYK